MLTYIMMRMCGHAYQVSVDEAIGLEVLHGRADLHAKVEDDLHLLHQILALTEVLQQTSLKEQRIQLMPTGDFQQPKPTVDHQLRDDEDRPLLRAHTVQLDQVFMPELPTSSQQEKWHEHVLYLPHSTCASTFTTCT